MINTDSTKSKSFFPKRAQEPRETGFGRLALIEAASARFSEGFRSFNR